MAGLLAACARGGRVHHADPQRLQALPPLLAGARPRHLGPRQSRRHGARAGRAGDPATRLENRVGEPAANPYLYMASQILAGLDGIERRLDPGPSADTPYETKAALLPKSAARGGRRAEGRPFFRDALGDDFVDYYLHIKQAEIDRFQAEVTSGSSANISRCFEPPPTGRRSPQRSRISRSTMMRLRPAALLFALFLFAPALSASALADWQASAVTHTRPRQRN